MTSSPRYSPAPLEFSTDDFETLPPTKKGTCKVVAPDWSSPLWKGLLSPTPMFAQAEILPHTRGYSRQNNSRPRDGGENIERPPRDPGAWPGGFATKGLAKVAAEAAREINDWKRRMLVGTVNHGKLAITHGEVGARLYTRFLDVATDNKLQRRDGRGQRCGGGGRKNRKLGEGRREKKWWNLATAVRDFMRG